MGNYFSGEEEKEELQGIDRNSTPHASEKKAAGAKFQDDDDDWVSDEEDGPLGGKDNWKAGGGRNKGRYTKKRRYTKKTKKTKKTRKKYRKKNSR